SVEIIAEQGERFGAALKEKLAVLAATAGTAFIRKIEVVREMTVFCRSVPDQWNEHERLGNTANGLAVHAMNLDIDVGPLLQTQKLLDSVVFARRKGYGRQLTAAELEMMNLTGDGNGYDMVTIPEDMRAQIPTSNFFLRNGYERNPVAIRNNTVAKLLAATNSIMDKGIMLQGAKDLAGAFLQAHAKGRVRGCGAWSDEAQKPFRAVDEAEHRGEREHQQENCRHQRDRQQEPVLLGIGKRNQRDDRGGRNI